MTFSIDVAEFVKKAGIAQETAIKKIALDVLSSVVMKTPVGNPSLWQSKPPKGYVGGRARASWGVGLNRIDADMAVTVTDKEGTQTIVKGQSAINQWKPGDEIFICSKLPYIHALEFGHSSQAPVGFVRITVVQFEEFVRQAIREAQ